MTTTGSPAAKVVVYQIYGGPVVAAVTSPTLYGWLGQWDTTQVASGNYLMVATACVNLWDSTTCSHAVENVTVTNPTIPTSIPSNCSSDATTALNQYLAGVANNSTVIFPANSCYSVSSPLLLENKSGVTVTGNGATIDQPSYVGGNAQEPVLTLGGDSGTTVNGLNIVGPGTGGGSSNEGDAGVLLWQDASLTLNGVNISGVEGDGLDLYAKNGNEGVVSTNVVVENSTIAAGYHAIVPEYVDGFTVQSSTVTAGDIDAEVDFSCQSTWPNGCGTLSNPSVGVVNMTIQNNSFPNGLRLLDGMSCMPVGNWNVLNNNLGNGGLDFEFDTTYSLSLSAFDTCGQYSGLTITGNTDTGQSRNPCCGAGSPYVLVQGWNNVNISNNNLVLPTNTPGAVIELWADSNVTLNNNTFTNAAGLWDSSEPAGWAPVSNLTATGNVPS